MIRRWDMEQLEGNKYINCVSLPLIVTLLRRSQLELISKFAPLIMYLDATGSVMKKPKCHPEHNCNKILYYACVIKVDTTIIPVAELISCKHDTTTILTFLMKFKSEMMLIPKLVLPLVYVVDWTWAYIQAILDTFNKMSVLEYIQYTYNCMNKRKSSTKNIVSIFICCTHFINIISIQIKKKIPNITTVGKNFILDLFCAILNCDTLEQVYAIFEVYCIICTNKYKTEAVIQAYNQFTEFLKSIYCHDDISTSFDKSNFQDCGNIIFENDRAHYSNSMYYKTF